MTRFNLDSETLTVIWTLTDSVDPASPFSSIWADMPATLHTGLTASAQLIDALRGTPIHQPLTAARAHVDDAYARVEPLLQALHAAHPEHVPLHAITPSRWTWACALWYAYSMQVHDSTEGRACLVPFASYFNHSLWPHIVQYGHLAAGEQLTLSTFRPCRPGEQLFLGYGAKDNAQLLQSYGFCIPDNPYDTLELSTAPTCSKAESDAPIGVLRGRVLDHLGLAQQSYKLTAAGLPPAAITHAAVLAAGAQALEALLAEPAPAGPWQRPPQV